MVPGHRGTKRRKPARNLWLIVSPRDVSQESTNHRATSTPFWDCHTEGRTKARAALFLALVLAAVQTQGAIWCHFISAGVIWDSNGLKI